MVSKLIPGIFCAAAISVLPALPACAASAVETNAQVCAGCHGATGEPNSAATPNIWGQKADWLYKELHDYHSGARGNSIMGSIAKNFTLPELRELANYFAAKPWPAAQAAKTAATAPAQAAMCKTCHGQNFEGGDPAPRLAGISYTYLITQMNGFAGGQRTNNLDMPGFMKTLSSSEREAIAHYLAGL